MIYVLHGENAIGIRNFILKLKASEDADLFEPKLSDFSVNEVALKYFSQGLFEKKSIFAFEIAKEKSFDFEPLLKSLAEKDSQNHLIFWQAGNISKTHPLLKAPLKLKILEFPLEEKPNIFAFLNALFEKRRKDAYKELLTLQKLNEEEMGFFSMIVSGVRNISFALFNSPAFDKLHPFVKKNVSAQAKKFTPKEIVEIYKFLYEQDLSLKTGKLTPDVILPLIIEKITGSHFA